MSSGYGGHGGGGGGMLGKVGTALGIGTGAAALGGAAMMGVKQPKFVVEERLAKICLFAEEVQKVKSSQVRSAHCWSWSGSLCSK